MLRQLSIKLMKYRLAVLAIIVGVTGFFGYHALTLEFLTDFNDLLPHGHPYVKIHKEFRERFGGANLTTLVLEVKEGDVFNLETLAKIQRINRAMYYIPNINNLQVASIADRKVKNIDSDAGGMYRAAVMWPLLPNNEEEIQALKKTLMSNDAIYGQYLSFNNKMLLLSADFWERAIDYRIIFAKLREIVEKEEDENHVIHMVGEPVLYGWVYHYFPQMVNIFILTIVVVIALLFLYSRNLRGTLLPLLSALISCSWGMGLAGMLGHNMDPLIMVIPFLITARVISHSVQMISRFYDEVAKVKDPVIAAERCFYGLFAPGTLSIITDAAGVAVVLITPIPLLEKLAIMGTFWVLSIFMSVIVLDPILLSYLPAPKVKIVAGKRNIYERFLGYVGKTAYGKGKYVTVGITLVVLVVGGYYSQFLIVGDINPGSPILWPDSTYNLDSAVVNKNFPGANQMYIVFDAKEEYKSKEMKRGKPATMVCKRRHVLRKFEEFQRYLERMDEVSFTVSLSDVIRMVNMKLMADSPRWNQVPMSRRHSGEIFYMLMASSEPGDLDKYTDPNYTQASIMAYFKDRKGDTIRAVIAAAKEFIENNPIE
jgi:predicted RND superfamily exporter protein